MEGVLRDRPSCPNAQRGERLSCGIFSVRLAGLREDWKTNFRLAASQGAANSFRRRALAGACRAGFRFESIRGEAAHQAAANQPRQALDQEIVGVVRAPALGPAGNRKVAHECGRSACGELETRRVMREPGDVFVGRAEQAARTRYQLLVQRTPRRIDKSKEDAFGRGGLEGFVAAAREQEAGEETGAGFFPAPERAKKTVAAQRT